MRFRRIFPMLIYSAIILLPLLLPLLAPDTPHEFDMFFHLERISEFYRQLKEGHIFPGWSTRLAFGFGSPVLMFNWSLPYYIASIALSFGATLLESFKFVTAFTYIGSFTSMYVFLAALTNPPAALVGAAWYIWAPYRFDIVQLRGAIGETTAMVFWPGIFWTTLLMFRKQYARGFFIGTIIWALLLYSHPDLFIMILPLWFVIILAETLLTKNIRALMGSLQAFGMSLGLMAFYLIPSYLEYHYLGYKLHENIYTQNFVLWEQLLAQPKLMEFGLSWGSLFKSIGWPLIAVALVSTLLCIADFRRVVADRIRAYRLIFLGMAGFAIFLLRPLSTVLWDHIPFLAFITYPQRFLGLMAFSVSVLAGLLAAGTTKRHPWIAIVMISGLILFDYPFVNLNSVRDSAESLSVRTLDTTDVWGEFMPKDMPKDFIINGRVYAQQPIVTVTPPNTISPQCSQTSVSITCRINSTRPVAVRFRQFYFPGWTAYADTDSIPINKHTDGTILLSLPKPTQTVRIVFIQTRLRVFSKFLTIIFAGWYIVLGVKTLYTYIRTFGKNQLPHEHF